MRRLALALLLAVTSTGVLAQPAPRLYWTHDGVGVVRFEVVIDKGTPLDVGLPTPSGQEYSVALPTMASGTHVLVIRACDANGVCASSVPLTFVKS